MGAQYKWRIQVSTCKIRAGAQILPGGGTARRWSRRWRPPCGAGTAGASWTWSRSWRSRTAQRPAQSATPGSPSRLFLLSPPPPPPPPGTGQRTLLYWKVPTIYGTYGTFKCIVSLGYTYFYLLDTVKWVKPLGLTNVRKKGWGGVLAGIITEQKIENGKRKRGQVQKKKEERGEISSVVHPKLFFSGSGSYLKGTVAWDFSPPFFFHQNYTPWSLIHIQNFF